LRAGGGWCGEDVLEGGRRLTCGGDVIEGGRWLPCDDSIVERVEVVAVCDCDVGLVANYQWIHAITIPVYMLEALIILRRKSAVIR
jgi:hypothetical protein